MGDNWEHIIAIEEVETGQSETQYPRYVDGERRAPPEDCGGTPGFESFLDAIANPRHPECGSACKKDPDSGVIGVAKRREERRGGTGRVGTRRSRWSPQH